MVVLLKELVHIFIAHSSRVSALSIIVLQQKCVDEMIQRQSFVFILFINDYYYFVLF